MYERELEQLRQQLSPERRPQSSGPDRLAYSSQTAQQKVTQWAEERYEGERGWRGPESRPRSPGRGGREACQSGTDLAKREILLLCLDC